jgi:hypothetical protein
MQIGYALGRIKNLKVKSQKTGKFLCLHFGAGLFYFSPASGGITF